MLALVGSVGSFSFFSAPKAATLRKRKFIQFCAAPNLYWNSSQRLQELALGDSVGSFSFFSAAEAADSVSFSALLTQESTFVQTRFSRSLGSFLKQTDLFLLKRFLTVRYPNQLSASDSFRFHKRPFPRRLQEGLLTTCLLYTSPSPRDLSTSRMPSSA